jgi:hypothetical protein
VDMAVASLLGTQRELGASDQRSVERSSANLDASIR